MWFFIDLGTTLECLIISLVFAGLLTLTSVRPLGILQSFAYSNKKLFGWAGRKNNMQQPRYSLLALSCLLTSAVLGLCFAFTGKWAAVISLAAYIIFFALYLAADAKKSFNSVIKLTPRIKRLLATLWLVFAILVYLATALLNFAAHVWSQPVFGYLRYCALAIFPLCVLPVTALANAITFIWEAPINKSYVKKAKAKLASADVITVGITGSYGKTSVKNILAAMLGVKYEVVSTPSSYNTPLGISKTINGASFKKGGIFIAEMGARNVGDIKELCAICPPDYSLITGICPQHLESFKTLKNIVATKGEIIAATKNVCIAEENAYAYYKDSAQNIEACSCVSEVEADCSGTSFTLTLGGEKKRIKCKLLGRHNAYNIGLCAQLAHALGVRMEDIAAAAENLPFVEHRLQLIENNGVYILDDGYNSNVVGARAAVEVLKSFGGRKLCVTPGLVELGVLEESENKLLGKELVGIDYVILVGETLVKCVMDGYVQAGGDCEKIMIVPTLAKAQEKIAGIIKKGDCVLFLNDLPDKYN